MSTAASVSPAPANAKLPYEESHFEALSRMRVLEAYYAWGFNLARRAVGRRVLDAGCGVGNLTDHLRHVADHVTGIDLSSLNVEAARKRFQDASNVEIIQGDLEDNLGELADRLFDTIVCFDVLEHIADDQAQLARFRTIIQPGGRLIIKVPALPWLFGAVDVASGHYRRYTRRTLRAVAAKAGWQVESVKYMNLAGVLPYWMKSRVLKRKSNFSRTFSPWQLRAIRTAIPVLRAADAVLGPPVGQSVMMIARAANVS